MSKNSFTQTLIGGAAAALTVTALLLGCSAPWYATQGRRLLAQLVPTDTPRKVGRPWHDEAHLEQIKTAVRGIDAAHLMKRTELARSAGITGSTLLTYLTDETR